MKTDGSRLIRLGAISSPHGVKGQVKIRSFTDDPRDISAYGTLRDKAGREFEVSITGCTNDLLIAAIKGVTTRDEAEALRGTDLFVPREALPRPKKNEYYHEDLIGLEVVQETGEPYGTITAMHNFGAGDLASIRRTSGEEEILPFTRGVFISIELEKGRIVISPPEILPE